MADIGAKISIDGEKKFKQELNNITQAGKTLSAEMNKLTSSFDSETSAEEKSIAVSKKLNEQVQNQKALVDKLKEAVQKSADKTGENSTETLKWKEKLAKAETELGKLEHQTDETGKEVKEFASEEQNASEKTSIFGDVLKANLVSDLIKNGIHALASAIKAVGQYLTEAVTGAAAFADEILTLEKVTGISTGTIQKYKYAASLLDVEFGTVEGALRKLTKTMSSAKDGSASATETFESLGVSVLDVSGNLRPAEAVFNDAITALGKIENETERDAVAMALFGKSAQELNPLIEAGGDALNKLGEEAESVGYVLDDTTLESLGRVQDGFDRLGLAADSAKNQIGAAIGEFILPYLEKLVGAVQTLLGGGDASEFVDTISEVVNSLVTALGNALPALLQAGVTIIGNLILGIEQMLPTLAPAAVELVSTLASFIITNLPSIINTGIEIIIAIVQGIGEQLPTLIPAAIQMVLTLVEGLYSHIGDIVTAAMMLLDGLVEGLTSESGINAIIEAVPVIMEAYVNGILNNLDKIIAAGINLIVNLAYGLVKAIPKLVSMIPNIITAIINAFKNFDWASLGQNIMDGVSDGVKSKATEMWTAVKDAVSTAVEWLKNLGGSALQWGSDFINGFLNGIKQAASALWGEVQNIAGMIAGIFHFSRPDFGPLREYERWMPDFMKGLAKGIKDNAYLVTDAAERVASGMVFDTPVGNVSNVANYGGVTINVTAKDGESADALADAIMRKIQTAVNQRKAVFA